MAPKLSIVIALLPAIACALLAVLCNFKSSWLLNDKPLLEVVGDLAVNLVTLGVPVAAWLMGVRSFQDISDLPPSAIVVAFFWVAVMVWLAREARKRVAVLDALAKGQGNP